MQHYIKLATVVHAPAHKYQTQEATEVCSVSYCIKKFVLSHTLRGHHESQVTTNSKNKFPKCHLHSVITCHTEGERYKQTVEQMISMNKQKPLSPPSQQCFTAFIIL